MERFGRDCVDLKWIWNMEMLPWRTLVKTSVSIQSIQVEHCSRSTYLRFMGSGVFNVRTSQSGAKERSHFKASDARPQCVTILPNTTRVMLGVSRSLTNLQRIGLELTCLHSSGNTPRLFDCTELLPVTVTCRYCNQYWDLCKRQGR